MGNVGLYKLTPVVYRSIITWIQLKPLSLEQGGEKIKVSNSILDLIGNTPLLRLDKVTTGIAADVFVKLEYLNPSGSLKDRVALYTIEEAEKKGLLRPGSTIVEASTGNTAIAFSLVTAVKGYKMKVLMPKLVATEEKVKMIRLYGAEVEVIDTEYLAETEYKSARGGFLQIIPRTKCLELEKSSPNVWWCRQFSNPAGVAAHRETTGKEILQQTSGKVDAFVTSVGSGGTLIGIGEALRAAIPKVKVIAAEPAGSPHIINGKSGIKVIEGITGGLLLDAVDMADEVLAINDEDAINMTNRLAKEEGLRCGMSSGANVVACLRIAKKYPELKNIITTLPDGRDRYLTKEKYIV